MSLSKAAVQTWTRPLVSYTGGCFLNKSLHTAFQEYHNTKKRFLLVHKDANLSDLRRNPNQGPCDACKQTRQLTWIFMEGVCDECRGDPGYRQNYLSQQQVKKRYGLSESDLTQVEYQPMPNPRTSNFSPMKLFRKLDVHAIAKSKHGSVEAALKLQTEKDAAIKKRKLQDFSTAASYGMVLRKPRAVQFVQWDGVADLATRDQKIAMASSGLTCVHNHDHRGLRGLER